MQLKKFFQATVLVTAFASFPLPSFASDSDAITSSLANLGHQVQKTRNAFEQYDGGAFSTLPLAAELYKVMTASTAARKSFEDSEPLAVDETPQVIEQYHNVRASIEEALQSVPSKVSAPFRKSRNQPFLADLIQVLTHASRPTISTRRALGS